ncbi:lytic transglycosylase domain-containing protein [[Clostridium] polysaccharolyticum]|uniref:Transglycosylase SLT domain-containing protein n=1 Tax=[Clostridium] polysaccharolyticum TaxID=29364 RepID=A0A1H9YNV8_9FIRM|nr:lytic transglycosylase domain-containing protein [[Clostridium] polysaccharolyticum]SES70754.1 Transglycosylase SLT domain-containing protein [[Clostridium] polysaccharolyticum]
MVNSIQLKGLTYVRSLPTDKALSKTDGEKFDSVLDKKINEQENNEKEIDKNSGTKYTNPEDLVCVDSPGSLETYFQEAADTYGVPVALIKAVAKAESDFNTQAVSSVGAQGIMQLMPATAKGLGVQNSFDARENILAGTKYLADKLTKYNGSVKLALAAYNAGSGNVDKYGGVPPFQETQNYIKKIFGYLGVDSAKHASKKEKTSEENTAQNASSGRLSEEDIQKLSNEIVRSISDKSSSSLSARDLYSQLYGNSDSSNMLSNYSSVINKLIN